MRSPLVFLLPVMFALVACGCAPGEEQAQTSFYVREVHQRLRAVERGIVAEYENVSGDRFEDDATLFDALRILVVPKLTELVATAKLARPGTDALRHLHDGYVSALEKELAAFQQYVLSLDQQDAEGQQRAMDQLREAEELMDAFERRLKEFCAERGVAMPPPEQDS